MEMKKMDGKDRKGIGKAVARIAAELRDFRMAPDTLREKVLTTCAPQIAEGKEWYVKKYGEGKAYERLLLYGKLRWGKDGYEIRWKGPHGLTRAAKRVAEKEIFEQVIREQSGRISEERPAPIAAWGESLIGWYPLPMRISLDLRKFGLERALSEEAAKALYSMLMRRVKMVTIDVETSVKDMRYYKEYFPHAESIDTARELVHLAKARGWIEEGLEARKKLAELKERQAEWRSTGRRYTEFWRARDKLMSSQLDSGQFSEVSLSVNMMVKMAGGSGGARG